MNSDLIFQTENNQPITACKLYCLAAGATQDNIAYSQTISGKHKRQQKTKNQQKSDLKDEQMLEQKLNPLDKKEVAKQVQEINKAIQKEVADRIQGDQDVRKQNLTSLEKGTKDLELKLTSMSHNLELTQLDIDHARNDLSTMAPQVHTSLQNTAELKGFLASQIFPTLQSIQSQVTTMRQNEEAKNYSNPLADNIAYHINKDAVEHKSDTPPATIQRSDGIKLRQSKSPVPLISAESFFGQNASAFQNQFRSPKPASSTGAVADATIKDTPTGQASRTTQIVQNVQNYFWGSSAAKAAQNQK